MAAGVANPVVYPLTAAVGRHGVRGIGSLAVAYGGAFAVRCALSVCCIAPTVVHLPSAVRCPSAALLLNR